MRLRVTRESARGTNANTPQQALTLLNDPTFVESARVLAATLLRDVNAGTDSGRLDALYERVLSRKPRDRERESLLKFLESQRAGVHRPAR
jgi:hypothetical protein